MRQMKIVFVIQSAVQHHQLHQMQDHQLQLPISDLYEQLGQKLSM